MKKIILSALALLAIVSAIYGVVSWQKKADSEPMRQEKEIR